MDAKILIMLFLFFGSVAIVLWLVIDAIWNAATIDDKDQVRQQPVIRLERRLVLFLKTLYR